MLEQILENTREYLELIYPRLVKWAVKYDYNIPSISTLAKYEIKFLDCMSYNSTYCGEIIQAIGTHYATERRIKIAGSRDTMGIMSTMLHEFGHAVQFFNFGKNWHMMYSTEAGKVSHSDNKYENEVRDLQAIHNDWIERDSMYAESVILFKFKFIQGYVPKPELPPPPTPKRYFERSTYYHIKDYDRNFYDKRFRKDWWNKS